VVTSSPTTYRCGNETFRVAFEEQRAYVTMPDSSLVTLRRLDTGSRPDGTHASACLLMSAKPPQVGRAA